MMIDHPIILIALMVVLISCLVYHDTETGIKTKTVSSNADDTNIPEIKIDKATYEKMVDVVTRYSLASEKHNEKMILIYLSTFHLFDMNYGYKSIGKLDNRLIHYPRYQGEGAEMFPYGSMHHNLQKAIIIHIMSNIVGSERQLVNDKTKDRVIIDLYLSGLFKGMEIM